MLDHLVQGAIGGQPLVLPACPLSLPGFEHHAFGRDLEHLSQGGQDSAAPRRHLCFRDACRCLVLLGDDPGVLCPINIHGKGVLRHVGVEESVAVDVVAPCPAADVAQVLAQTDREHAGVRAPGAVPVGAGVGVHGGPPGGDLVAAEQTGQRSVIQLLAI